jgi:hypothetical protein
MRAGGGQRTSTETARSLLCFAFPLNRMYGVQLGARSWHWSLGGRLGVPAGHAWCDMDHLSLVAIGGAASRKEKAPDLLATPWVGTAVQQGQRCRRDAQEGHSPCVA